jgi:hypothetical protein
MYSGHNDAQLVDVVAERGPQRGNRAIPKS